MISSIGFNMRKQILSYNAGGGVGGWFGTNLLEGEFVRIFKKYLDTHTKKIHRHTRMKIYIICIYVHTYMCTHTYVCVYLLFYTYLEKYFHMYM